MQSQKPNKLIHEASPYLLQHAYNPVMWYPWGDEAFQKAKSENKPIFLSIGYSTCHWCHVMEKESFEDEEVAALLNKVCVPIKVDREERPDIDHIYMTVCQVMTGSGGWPLNLFLTPEREPFFAGTYFPKKTRFGRVGLIELVTHMTNLWTQENNKALTAAGQMVGMLEEISNQSKSAILDKSIFEKSFRQLEERYDNVYGGFGSAPKFPSPHVLMFLLRYYKKTRNRLSLEMVEKTLESMRNEGIYDHIGFGFHRYSTDDRWHLPHFEKMLYDQAMHIMAYTEAFQVTQKTKYKKTVEEIIEYLERDMRSDEGGFYSAEDADSEGEEGKCYVWTLNELQDVLGKDVELFRKIFNVKDDGNFVEEATKKSMGSNIICFREPLENIAVKENLSEEKLYKFINKSITGLLKKRKTRIPPHKDDKILTDWNGLVIAALAKAGSVLGESKYIDLAEKTYSFICNKMICDGKLMHSYRNGHVKGHGNLDDYAFVICGLLELYNATFREEYLIKASELNAILLKHFWDEKVGGFYFMPDYAEKVLVRKKEYFDGAIPSGNSVCVLNLIKLGKYLKLPVLLEYANKTVSAFGQAVNEYPLGYSMFMIALGSVLYGSNEIVIVSDKKSEKYTTEILYALNEFYNPDSIKIYIDKDHMPNRLFELNPVLRNYKMINNKPTVYICENYSCKEPITDMVKLKEVLAGMVNLESNVTNG